MTARNAPCPCGSGKKFKHCHGLARPTGTPTANGANLLERARRALNARDPDEAVKLAERAPAGVARSRSLAHALMMRRQSGDLERARQALEDWSSRRPSDPEPWRRLLEIDYHRGRLEDAAASLEAFAGRNPPASDVAYHEAILRQLRHGPERAMPAYERAVTLRRAASGMPPLDRAALAVAAAMQVYETAAGNYPGSPGGQPEGMFDHDLEVTLLETRLSEWEISARAHPAAMTVELARTHADAWYNLGCAAMARFAGHDLAIRRFRSALALDAGHELARMNAVFALNYSETASPGEIYAAHCEAGDWLLQRHGEPDRVFDNDRRPDRRLRVGYLSSDFRSHSVAHFIVPVLECHDPHRFEVAAYYSHHQHDDYTARVRDHCALFREVADLSDSALCRQIIADRIDILVDLNGLTRRNRMAVLAMRAAPLQMSWIGYPNTTGLRTVDYRLVDAVTDPPDAAWRLATERLLRLPGGFSVYQPPRDVPPVGPLPGAATGAITFASFNSMPKLNEPLLRNWAGILRRVPGSRLLIKNVALGYSTPRRQLLDILGRQGIAPHRIELVGHTTDQREHLEHYQRVDIALDSFPYNGTTTTCESLLMGAPVVSRAGPDHRSRVGASQLRLVGLESLVASDENRILEIAADLAANPERLAEIRAGLRGRLLSSPLTEAHDFTRDLEAAFQQAWARWCAHEEQS